jgi:c-di-GMP-specific phosphodiesterase
MSKGSERFVWDVTAALESLGAAGIVLWTWEPDRDRLRMIGSARPLGLGPLTPECSSAALLALALPQDRDLAQDFLKPRPPGSPMTGRIRMRGGESCLWRGVWLEEGGVRAAGVVAPETHFAAAGRDTLTGLIDRQAFIAAARERLHNPVEQTLVVADLDRLRRLNEALGHERADLVLAALGSRLAAAFPCHALLGRVGEDEFAVLVDASAPDPGAELRAALEQPLRVAGFDIYPTLSIGAVQAKGGPDAPEAAELLRRAELAVESAKTGGRGQAAAYGRGLESDSLSRLALENDLRGAIQRGEITPFYQPVVRLKTGAISGFEALARWRHPRRGLVAPDDFLPLLTELGLLPELGAHMLKVAAHQLAEWRKRHHAAGDLTCSVNLSTGEIDREDLVPSVARVLRETGLPAGAIKLEVTESDIMRNPENAAIVLQKLREAGAGLALDDFGTGFSSLSYLTRLPFDTLKIDRYFVRTMGANEGSAKIVRSVINLGRDLFLEVVAVGVENAAMAQQLMEIGCDYGQGFGYAPALSAQEAEVYLNESYADGAAPVKARG